MVEALRVGLGVLVVASLIILVAYVVGFLAVVLWTVLRRSRRDPLAEELDQILDEILKNTRGARNGPPPRAAERTNRQVPKAS